jgi:hypothetical protein
MGRRAGRPCVKCNLATGPSKELQANVGFRARHAGSFERVAVVRDEDWMRPAPTALSVLLPGKAKGFKTVDLEGLRPGSQKAEAIS